jgi:hypothetical protein
MESVLLTLALIAAPAKEPGYAGKPQYLGLQSGEARAWLVLDGETLYVDRDGDGDLTGPTKKVKGKKDRDSLSFEVGEVRLGGRTHKGLAIALSPLGTFNDSLLEIEGVKAVLAKRSKAVAAWVSIDAEVPGLKGGQPGGRVKVIAGPIDGAGPLMFAESPDRAPAVRLGGTLHVTFFLPPTLRVGKNAEPALVVGYPGEGPGTFASVAYEGTIPAKAFCKAEITYPAREGAHPVKRLYELKERC